MRKLKFALVLPLLFCALEGVLWYYEHHSALTVRDPFLEDGYLKVSPARPIRMGVNAPAYLATVCVYVTLDRAWSVWHPQSAIGEPGFEITLLLVIFVCWMFIGHRLDRFLSRDSKGAAPKRGSSLTRTFLYRLPPIGIGVFFLLLSTHLRSHPSEIVEKVLLWIWAVFLIGVPCASLVSSYQARRQLKISDSNVQG